MALMGLAVGLAGVATVGALVTGRDTEGEGGVTTTG